MGQQSSAGVACRLILPRAEHDVAAYREGPGTHTVRRIRRVCIGMHPHLAEVGAEARLKKSSHGRRQRLAPSAKGPDAGTESRRNRRWLCRACFLLKRPLFSFLVIRCFFVCRALKGGRIRLIRSGLFFVLFLPLKERSRTVGKRGLRRPVSRVVLPRILFRRFYFRLALNQRRDLFRNRLGPDLLLVLARRTLRKWSAGFSLDCRLRHTHDLIGHPVRFLLIHVVRCADFQFWLQQAGPEQPLHRLVADGSLKEYSAACGRKRGRGPAGSSCCWSGLLGVFLPYFSSSGFLAHNLRSAPFNADMAGIPYRRAAAMAMRSETSKPPRGRKGSQLTRNKAIPSVF